MRFQRVSGVWRYVGLFAMVVYFISFGSFMSRMMSLDPSADRYSATVDWTMDLHRSTREVMQTASTTSKNQHAEAHKATINPLSLDIHKSGPSPLRPAASDAPKLPQPFSPVGKSLPGQSSPDSVPVKPEVLLKPEAETDERPEEKLLRQFELQRNLSGVAKPKHVEEAIRYLGGSAKNNLTGVETGNGSTAGDDHVVNPHPFRYLLNCENLCRKAPDIFLLVYVHTAPDHYKRRMVIRQTWGNVEQYSVTIRVVFFTGVPDSVGVQRALQFEAEQYGDVVQEDFVDSYKNLTYKGIAALKWISNYCTSARFVLKTDDDIFVNMFTLIRHLEHLRPKPGEKEVRRLLKCLVWNGMPVMRSGKWMVSKEEWKEDMYSTYCSGSAYLFSTDLAIALHEVSYHVPFFWVDDFYITGLLPLKLGNVNHTQFMSTYLLNGNALEENFTGTQWYKFIFSHVHNLDAIQMVWRKVVALVKGELVPKIQYLVPKNLTGAPRSH